MVEYSELPEVPGKLYFRCDRQRATLSTTACAESWRRADDLNDGSCHACKLCPIGAVHAGEVAASRSPLKGTLTCARCHRTAGRLISGMVCVSCKNREYELVKGRNAKGAAPVKLQRLCQRRVFIRHGDELRVLVRQRSVDTDELIVAALRDSKKAVTFAWDCTPPKAIRQARLW